jgi:predicted ester cyclase
MESQQMKDLVIRFVDHFWSSDNMDAAAREMMTSDVIIHEPEVQGGNVEGLKAFAKMLRVALPDWHSTAEELVAEGDMVVERWTGRGTHKGPLFGAQPTGAKVELPGVVFYRTRDGKICEFRGLFDRYALFQQIGLTPA